jgi:glycosyltransferase involved in cell wall biosynthesis
MVPPVVSVVVPTRGRAAYLEVTLDSLLAQRTEAEYEIVVVDDGAPDATAAVVTDRPGVRYASHGEGRGLNAARNTGLRESRAPLIAFVDDDVLVPPGWVDALVEGSQRHTTAEAFAGPIRARFEGRTPRGCGREDPPITTLDLNRLVFPLDTMANLLCHHLRSLYRSQFQIRSLLPLLHLLL